MLLLLQLKNVSSFFTKLISEKIIWWFDSKNSEAIDSWLVAFFSLLPTGDIYPAEAQVLYQPGATFDHNYNRHFKPYFFNVSKEHTKVISSPPLTCGFLKFRLDITILLNLFSLSHFFQVVIYAVITGHGSDDNNCGEFCVTSHHFIINGKEHSIKFNNAGKKFFFF